MPLYKPEHLEYSITSGRIQIAMEDGTSLPAYWAHPRMGDIFPGVVLIHDWWGITETERSLADWFAQMGYYVIAPDLYHGAVAQTPAEAMERIKKLDDGSGYSYVNTALHVLETHHRSNRSVAAVGLGMGGSLAFEAAVKRTDLEAAVIYYGFPQRFFGKFITAPTPILALYGSAEPHIAPALVEQLKQEFASAQKPHQLEVIGGAARDFFTNDQRDFSKIVLEKTLAFLMTHLKQPRRPTSKGVL